MWGKALSSYDLHSTLPEVTRQVGIVEVRPERGGLLKSFFIGSVSHYSCIHGQSCLPDEWAKRDAVGDVRLTRPSRPWCAGPAELWSERRPGHVPAGAGQRGRGVGAGAEGAPLPGRLAEHPVGLRPAREVRNMFSDNVCLLSGASPASVARGGVGQHGRLSVYHEALAV